MEIKMTPHPDSPKSILERAYRGMVFSSKDWGTNAFDVALYGIVAGWDYQDNSEGEELLKSFSEFGIEKEDLLALEEMHESFIQIQNKYYR